jgi:predicted metal-dependent hydrolase
MTEAIHDLKIAFRRSRRARNLRITIDPTQAITVTVPANLSLEYAEKFVQFKQAWIQKHLCKIREEKENQLFQSELSRDELNRAQDELFERLGYFSKKHKLPYNRAAFRCQKTRWGSCSGQNNISLNINIAFLPEHLQDYILLHELCHIWHKNHSKAFWTQLDKYCGVRAKEYAKELKTHRTRIKI